MFLQCLHTVLILSSQKRLMRMEEGLEAGSKDAQRYENRLYSEQPCRLGLFSLEEGYRVEEEVYKIMSGPERMGGSTVGSVF